MMMTTTLGTDARRREMRGVDLFSRRPESWWRGSEAKEVSILAPRQELLTGF